MAVVGLVLVVAGGLAAWIAYREISSDLPPVDKLLRYQLPVATRVYADDGTLLGEFYTEKRYLVSIARIPLVVRQAFIAAEDANFYRHKGVDVPGIVRAMLANVAAGEVVQGASTITQQVVKAILLTPEKSYERKAKEILLALRLERQLSKDEILYLYLNLIYLGNGAYGVGAAAQEYFGKDVSELSLAEGALLAGLPQAPSRYSPVKHWERAKHRQRYVLERMAREHLVSWDEAEAALKAPIQLARNDGQAPTYLAAPYFVEHVRRQLEERYGGTAAYQLGLNVYTTVNLATQRAAEKALREGIKEVDHGRTRARALRRLNARQAERLLASARANKDAAPPEPGRSYRALVLGSAERGGFRVQVKRFTGRLIATKAHPLPPDLGRNDLIAVRRLAGAADALTFEVDLDPQLEGALVSFDLSTGYVRAMVGGYDYRRSEFNRAMQALRQPGSSFKPFIYAAALDRGYTPASIIVDAPIVLPGAREAWVPQNYDEKFKGPTTLRNALAYSRNVVTVKVAQDIGLNYLVGYLPRFGFSHPFEKNLSIALGSAEVTLFELTRAYTVFANAGRRLEPIVITKITDPHGTLLEEFKPTSQPVVSAETAYLVTSMLETVVQRGTGRRVRKLGRPVAGKTGTTNDMHDAWFIGFTPDVATGVWVGYDSERSLGEKQTGGHVAAPIFLAFMEAALVDAPVHDFSVPDGITFVSLEPGSGRPASPESTNAFLECFKQGTEPRRREVEEDAPYYEDDLERAVARLRAPGADTYGEDVDGDREFAGREESLWEDAPGMAGPAPDLDEEAGWERGEYESPEERRRRHLSRGLDERPPPRAEDYLEHEDAKYGRDDEDDYRRPRARDRLSPPRRSEAEAGEYRSNEPRRGRGIIEEPLGY